MAGTVSVRRLHPRRLLVAAVVCSAIFTVVVPTTTAEAVDPAPSLTEISCRNANFCVAVGFTNSHTAPRRPFIEMWNGNKWKQNASPNVAGAWLSSVSCGSATSCVAVGQRGSPPKTFAEHWNGTHWTVTASPSPAKEAQFESVSCVTAKFCIAVGWSMDAKPNVRTLVARWNGSSWKLLPSPNYPKSGLVDSDLAGVSCTSVTRCFAVGSSYNPAGYRDLFILRWNGKVWSVSARQELTTGINGLRSVSCVGKTVCIAVGADVSSPGRELKDHWNGKTWRASVNSSATVPLNLNSVSCASATHCLAVGNRDFEYPHAERWNGTKWSRIAPPPSTAFGFSSVACLRSGSCYAVGGNDMLFWNGATWSTVADAA